MDAAVQSADATAADPARRRLEAALGVPFTTGNAVTVLRNGVEAFPAVLGMVADARRSIDLLWFLWGRGAVTDRVADALAERSRAGVRVRVLLDGFGAKGIAAHQVERLRDAGCQVAFYRPFLGWRLTTSNLRTHRRVLVCDERVGFTGGLGIDAAWTGDADRPASWRDTGFRLEGPVVDGLRGAFALDWLQTPYALSDDTDAFPVHDRPGSVAAQLVAPTSQPGLNASALAALTLLELAEERIDISTPYSRLPDRVHVTLARAVGRGVRVRLLVPGPHADRPVVAAQGRREYGRLFDAGVEVWEYAPTMLHTKLVSVDGRLALAGTTNADVRSLTLNEQVGLVLADADVVGRLDEHFAQDLEASDRVSPQRWRQRGAVQRWGEAAATVVGAPLRGLGTSGLTRTPS